jgi:hypothetical protein
MTPEDKGALSDSLEIMKDKLRSNDFAGKANVKKLINFIDEQTQKTDLSRSSSIESGTNISASSSSESTQISTSSTTPLMRSDSSSSISSIKSDKSIDVKQLIENIDLQIDRQINQDLVRF